MITIVLTIKWLLIVSKSPYYEIILKSYLPAARSRERRSPGGRRSPGSRSLPGVMYVYICIYIYIEIMLCHLCYLYSYLKFTYLLIVIYILKLLGGRSPGSRVAVAFLRSEMPKYK